MTISLTVLGSSGRFATRERACSGYLVQVGSFRLWMDAGAGTWRNLLGHVDYPWIDGILLTHRHPDHVSDVFQVEHAWLYGKAEPLPSIPLWAPAETLERMVGYVPDLHDAFDLTMIKAGMSLDVGEATVTLVEMAHPPETVGVRIEARGAVVAYSSDTGPTADLVGLARDADVFVCEATLQDSDDEWEGHMRASQAGEAAAAAGTHRLLLTHLPHDRDLGLSLVEAHKAAPEAEVRLASDGLTIEVGR